MDRVLSVGNGGTFQMLANFAIGGRGVGLKSLYETQLGLASAG
jgi:hypothetical protein